MEELIKFIGIRINEVALSLIQVINSKKSLVTCIGTWKCNSHIFVTLEAWTVEKRYGRIRLH
jgi:hypothetical protein